MLGRYIDRLPPEAKDRIIENQAWCRGEYLGDNGERCLVAAAEVWDKEIDDALSVRDLKTQCIRYVFENEYHPGGRRRTWRSVDWQFDKLTRRFGMERIVRAIKQRAARSNRVEDLLAGRVTTEVTESQSR